MRPGLAAASVLLLACAFLSGCAQQQEPAPASVDLPATRLRPDPLGAAPGAAGGDAAPPAPGAPPQGGAGTAPAPETQAAVLRMGAVLAWEGSCPCPSFRFLLEPEGADWLEVRVRWDGTQVADLGLDVSLAGASKEGARGFDARRVTWFSPPPGRVDVLLEGTGAFQAEAFLRSRLPAPDAPRLPDLTTTVPVDMHVGGCHEVERVEQGARKCLRLGNGVSNPGHGPLQVFLDVVSGVQALVLEGRFVQEVLQADGSWSRHPVGPAAFHAAHAHWHYDGLAAFSLHPVGADGLRGEAVAAHHKAGFCFLDWDRMPEDETQAGQGGNAEADCLVPGVQGWSNGVSAGWYDFYGSYLADQYVDIAGVPDGLYELVSVADPAGGLLERDRTNNAASVLLRLVGDRVSVLEERGWYRVQPEDA